LFCLFYPVISVMRRNGAYHFLGPQQMAWLFSKLRSFWPRLWFVGLPVFCLLSHPAGKPADYRPGGEPYNEIYQVHLLSPFRVLFTSGFSAVAC
jgi:hypothetical protein